MKIFVNVKPRSKREFLKKIEDEHFVVAVNDSPERGKANRAVAKAIANYFNIAVSRVGIVSGQTSKQKVFEIG